MLTNKQPGIILNLERESKPMADREHKYDVATRHFYPRHWKGSFENCSEGDFCFMGNEWKVIENYDVRYWAWPITDAQEGSFIAEKGEKSEPYYWDEELITQGTVYEVFDAANGEGIAWFKRKHDAFAQLRYLERERRVQLYSDAPDSRGPVTDSDLWPEGYSSEEEKRRADIFDLAGCSRNRVFLMRYEGETVYQEPMTDLRDIFKNDKFADCVYSAYDKVKVGTRKQRGIIHDTLINRNEPYELEDTRELKRKAGS